MAPRNKEDIAGTPYCLDKSQTPLLDDLSGRVREMRKAGRLTPEVLQRIRHYFRIKSIYHSNAIEGNILDVGETRQVVELGLTITGKPLKDQAEAKNLKDALDFLEDLVKSTDRPITEADVRQIHSLVLKDVDDDNAGRYRNVPVAISGSAFTPPAPESVPSRMHEFGLWLASVSSIKTDDYGSFDAIVHAAVAHTWFVYIHPFIDGNGRVARLMMNLLLMRCAYPIAIITKEDRFRYYDALKESQGSDLSAFVSLLMECIGESLEEYEEAAKAQRGQEEWATALASRFSGKEAVRARNEYEVWKSAMELLRGHFRRMAELPDESALAGKVYFKDFGVPAYEKYLSLRSGESAKKTWFFRMDFVGGEGTARYLFSFGRPDPTPGEQTGVTLHLSREEPPGSLHYESLETIDAPNVPDILAIGYRAEAERFAVKGKSGREEMDKMENIGKSFLEQAISCHFKT